MVSTVVGVVTVVVGVVTDVVVGAVSSLDPQPASGAAVSAMPIPTVIDHFRTRTQGSPLRAVLVGRVIDMVRLQFQPGHFLHSERLGSH